MKICSPLVWSLFLLAGSTVLPGCGPKTQPAAPKLISDQDRKEFSNELRVTEINERIRFTSSAKAAGVEFTYVNGARGDSLMVESTGGGVGFLDYDVDGREDIYFSQGGLAVAPHDDQQPNDAIFRQIAGQQFRAMENAARISERRYGQGVCVGDYNDDGFDDVFVTNIGRDTLWRNMGDGTFLDVTEEAGVADDRWSSSAAFADLDLDGDLDLYCCHYCVYDVFNPIDCRDVKGQRRTCHPKDVPASSDECFFNQGDGTFLPEAKKRGLFGPGNKSLGVVISDFDLDGDPDIYIANDTTENFYFENDGKASFKELAKRRGCAVNRNGLRQASMGLAFGDYDRDGWQDFYSTHFYADSNTLYRNLGGRKGFEDVTGFMNLHEPTLAFLGFGTVMQDFDQDGYMELLVANGHVESKIEKSLYEMRPQLFTYNGEDFDEVLETAGEYFQGRYVGRGVATADFDEDGDLDALMVHQNKPAELLRNDSERGEWLKLSFRGTSANRRGIGCHVVAETPAGKKFTAELCGGSSYLASMEPALVIGLGKEKGPLKLTVRWPGGGKQVLRDVEPGQVLQIDQSESQFE
jgi:enediyne biosynthesis protein E4